MIDHLSLGTANLARALIFYDAALGALGVVRLWTTSDAAGYGPAGGDDQLAIKERSGVIAASAGFHIAFTARTRRAVDAFYARALAHGGVNDGPPDLRPQYGDCYYAAFVIDPDRHHLEAVCHT